MSEQESNFPPVQHLVLDALAARWRTGEDTWTFPSKVRPALVALERHGLIGWKSGVVQNTCQAWLTDKGKRVALSPTYVPPRATVRGQPWEKVCVLDRCPAKGQPIGSHAHSPALDGWEPADG